MKKATKKHHGKPVPTFRTLEEESAFWDEHSPLTHGEWEEVPAGAIVASRSDSPRRQISLRVDSDVIGALRKKAARQGIGFPELVRQILRRNAGAAR